MMKLYWTDILLAGVVAGALLLLALALAGCAAQPNLMPSNRKLAMTSHDLPVPAVVLVFPMFQYWPGVETNYSQLQCSSNLVDWQTLPPVYYGAPGPTSQVTIKIDQPQQFYRMMRVP